MRQIDCFKINMAYWKFLGIWPGETRSQFYKYYGIVFMTLFVITYFILLALNFYFLPRHLDVFIDELVFIFTEIAIVSKMLTVYFMYDKIKCIFDMLESDVFQPQASDALNIIVNAKKFIKRYFTIVAVVSYISNIIHISSPLAAHILLSVKLELPVCSYSFMSDSYKDMFIYPLYLYQSFGMHCHMLVNVNTDSFILGIMVLTIAQVRVLDYNLRHLTYYKGPNDELSEKEKVFKRRLRKCISHFVEIDKFCGLIEEIFGKCLFVQFCSSSCIICAVLFRFTLPASAAYFIFLTTYMAAMLEQILMPTWFGTHITETSSSLSEAIYSCEWIPRSRPFRSSVVMFVERMKKPLSITAWKMFPLSLTTFTKIMNTAYSFFTLLRNMQALDS